MEQFALGSVRIFDGQGNPASIEDVVTTLRARLPTDIKGKIFVGTDGHVHGDKYSFLSTICLRGDGTGGFFYKFRTFIPRKIFASLHQRLLAEAQRSIEVAVQLMEVAPDLTADKFVLHLDVNEAKSSHSSGKSAESLRSYVRAYGFECEIKPHSWAANAIADKYAR